jgi:hypothetical protein
MRNRLGLNQARSIFKERVTASGERRASHYDLREFRGSKLHPWSSLPKEPDSQ